MTIADFIHLRVHSAYSLAEGAIRVVEGKGKGPRKDLIKLCLQHDMPAVALTDKGNLFGALEFAMAASEIGIQPIIGCQVALIRPEQATTGKIPARRDLYDQLVLLVQNELGYRNLSALVTQSFIVTDRPDPYVTYEELARYAGGLVALSGGAEGPIGRLLLENQAPAADERLGRLKELFYDRFYMEIGRHHGGEVGQNEQKIEAAQIDLAYQHNLPLVATNDVYFGTEDMYEAHDALLCISDKVVIAQQNRRRLTPDHRFKSAAEMRALFADLPEACDNTLVIAKRCAFMPEPRRPILPPFPMEVERTEVEELRAQAEEGLNKRLESLGITDRKAYDDRLSFELDIIIKMGFPGYFLIVSDFIKWSKTNNVPVGPGRGSGAGSVVAWALLITDLDPLRFGLLFERFLNPERVSMPDFDVDFCQERRDLVIQYVQSKYGADRVAQIITYGKLQARAVLRDVGRVLAMPYGYVDKICKLVPSNPANPVSLGQALEMEPQLEQMRQADATVKQLMDIALKLEGLYRNASTHAAGVVIGDRPLVDLVPLYRDPDSPLPATQFNMKMVEIAGLVKFDFLGLKTLDVIQNAVDLLKERGVDVDLAHIPLDDEKSYTLLTRGDTTGVFQLESSGMRDMLRRLKPNRFEDIIALVALYRPGPMDNIPTYIKCKNGLEEVHYLHPLLEPILKDTFGILIYQEQVMQAAQILAGYSLGGADLLRRAMGKKKAEEMAKQRNTFKEGAAKLHGIPEEQAELIFDQIDKFAGYGFNKSHAAAYALIAYQTAWLKANYPVEFFAAAMNFEMNDTDKLSVFRQELNRHGILLLQPSVNHSFPTFRPEIQESGKGAIRYALAAIKGVGAAAMQSLVAARGQAGPFKDLFDFVERVDPRAINRKQMEGLASAGAFDLLCKSRAQVIGSIDILLKHAHAVVDEKASGQASIFGAMDMALPRPNLPTTKAWDELTRLQNEFKSLGFYLSAHPLDNYSALLERLGAVSIVEVPARRQAQGSGRMKLAGIVMARQERTSKSGNRFAFVSASDATGSFEVTVFSDLLTSTREILEAGQAVLVDVDVQGGQGQASAESGGGDIRFIARSFERLSDVASRLAQGIRIKLYDGAVLPAIQKQLSTATAGRGKVLLALDLDDEVAEVELPGSWLLTDDLKSSLRQIGYGLEVQEW
ncbi:MAG: DNA polymerase III subunit alpha [Alphaproteobacteria bacterium]|nr:DNA polymerase III subunit alpha [Alphaproteobacteria bacterium]